MKVAGGVHCSKMLIFKPIKHLKCFRTIQKRFQWINIPIISLLQAQLQANDCILRKG